MTEIVNGSEGVHRELFCECCAMSRYNEDYDPTMGEAFRFNVVDTELLTLIALIAPSLFQGCLPDIHLSQKSTRLCA